MSASNFDSSGVRWSSSAPNLSALARRAALGADRAIAWLMILLLFACVTIAIYDLYLLLAALR